MIHHTAGYCSNGSRVVNGVSGFNLDSYLEYNTSFHPGRALFVDGKCVHQGNLSKEQCDGIEEELKGATADKDTSPYS